MIQFLDGGVLIRSGQVGMSSDCCCTPSCYPNACLLNPRSLCCQHYCPEADDCRHINSFEVNISGVGGAITCPSTGGTACCYAFDCECDLFNATFIHEHDAICGGSSPPDLNGCINRWQLRSPSYTGISSSDGCNIPPTFACGPWISERAVYIETGFANYQQAYTAGFVVNLLLPNAFTTFGSWQICNDYTIVPGHYIVVIMQHIVRQPFNVDGWGTDKMYLYPFANGVKRYETCAEDNYYPVGNFIGGDAVLFASRRFEIDNTVGRPPRVYTWDCNDWDYTCQLADATVTVEPPDYDLCEESEEPPPP